MFEVIPLLFKYCYLELMKQSIRRNNSNILFIEIMSQSKNKLKTFKMLCN